MVPVGKSEDNFLVNLLLVGELRIMNDDRATQTVWVLAIIVRVVPVCAGLVDLQMSEMCQCICPCREGNQEGKMRWAEAYSEVVCE